MARVINALANQTSINISEEYHSHELLISCVDAHSLFPFGFSKDLLQQSDETKEEREMDEENIRHQEVEGGTTGNRSVDIVLIQHLLHCEFLLQHLQVRTG